MAIDYVTWKIVEKKLDYLKHRRTIYNSLILRVWFVSYIDGWTLS